MSDSQLAQLIQNREDRSTDHEVQSESIKS